MFTETINGISLTFETADTSFSPLGADLGTLAMLSAAFSENAVINAGATLLDLGCGYGLVGVYAAKLIGAENIVMSDVCEDSVALARKNADLNNVGGVKIIQSDGFRDIRDSGFSLILSNPPYHTDFSVAKHFIEKGFNRLVIGGKMFMVTKRRDWYKNKLSSVFGGVRITETDGYYVFCAEKRNANYAKRRKHD
ncbi:MAG: methyltransferase [Oscillospiraceae bacterium]|nr:methyltransferase [Oscillospiraceae bacterium]